MNQKTGYIIITVIIIIVASVVFLGIIAGENNNPSGNTKFNENIIRTTGFSVNSGSASVNTSAEGTVFVRGSGEVPESVQIVARILIDPEDWGGIAFYIPDGWHISGITSSYPENKSGAVPDEQIATWSTADPDHEWNAMIEVGRDRRDLYTPEGGGRGTVVIDLVPEDEKYLLNTSSIMVAVGSDERDGVMICHPDFIEVVI